MKKSIVAIMMAVTLVGSSLAFPVQAYAQDVNQGEVLEENTGAIETNNGTVKSNGTLGGSILWTIETNNGTVETNWGEVKTNNGTVTINEYLVKDNYGTITENNNKVTNNYGTVTENKGTVTNNYGGTVNNVGNGYVTNQWYEYILTGGSYLSVSRTTTADNRTWIGKANSEEDINNLILDSLRTKGLVNDDIEVVKALDRDIVGKSNVIPVQLKNDGGYHSQSKIMSEQDLRLLGEYTMYKLRNMGNEIIAGNIAKNPIEIDSKTDSCSYCAFKESCGFDTGLDGYEMRKLEKIKDEEILEMMRTDIEEE